MKLLDSGIIKTPVRMVLSILLTSIPLLSVHAGAADFRELVSEYENYKGPDYMIENLSAAQASVERKSASMVLSGGAGSEIERVRKELSQRKERALRALDEAVRRNRLFRPEAALWQKVAAKVEEGGIEELLKEDFSLDTVIVTGLLNSPDVKRAELRARAALEKYDQVSNLDEILSQYAVFTRNLDIRIGEPLHNKPVVMNFPFPGMLSLKGNIVDKEVELSTLELERTVEDLVTDIKKTYFETAYLYKAVDITKEVLALLVRLKSVVNTVYTTGKSSLNDVIKIQMEIDRIKNDLVALEEQKKTEQVKLNKLINISEDFVPDSIEELKPVKLRYSKDELFKRGGRERNEIRTLEKDIKRMELIITMAEKRFYPDFTPGFSFFQGRIIKQVGTDAPEPAFSTRPMVRGADWFGSNDAYIRETKERYKSMLEALKELRNDTVSEIDRTLYRYENAERFRDLYASKLVPKSRLTIDVTEAQYITGKVDFMDLINSQELFLKYSLLLKRSIRDMNIEAARLERMVGSSIEKE